jgi:hypothetical protein
MNAEGRTYLAGRRCRVCYRKVRRKRLRSVGELRGQA